MCMLRENRDLNEYDFVLFHLYESNPDYKEYYKRMRVEHPDRLMIFDNSAYEYFVKGETLDMQKYVDAIIDLKPDLYILPDVLRDKEKTVAGVRKFADEFMYSEKYSWNLMATSCPLAVAQGSSSADLVECIEMYKDMGLTAIGIPFHLDFYTEGQYSQDIESEFMRVYGVENQDIRYAMGRIRWVREHEELLKGFAYVHMFGSHCPLEVVFYNDYNSMDTGYPVKCAIEGTALGTERQKPSCIIDDFLGKDLPQDTRDLIRSNVQQFKDYRKPATDQ